MIRRGLLMGPLAFGTVLAGVVIAAFATGVEQRDTTKAAVGSCAVYAGVPAEAGETAGMAFIPGDSFKMGSERHQPEERFTHLVRVDGFWIDRHEVTNAQFRQFADATGYRSLAERGLDPKAHAKCPRSCWLRVRWFSSSRPIAWWQDHPVVAIRPRRELAPAEGPGSSIAGKDNHPVVHVAYEDALAYARWRGRELPTEAQWEFAARGGRDGEDDWSSAFDADGKPIANTWQGIFPVLDTKDDGYAGTAPVGCFKPNGYGLYDMIGNVWEWTSDWYQRGHPREAAVNPTGPDLVSIRVAPGQARAASSRAAPSVRRQLLLALPAGRAPAPGNQPQCDALGLPYCVEQAAR